MRYSIKNEFQYSDSDNDTINKYINGRIFSQIDWYEKKSVGYQKKYKIYTSISIIVSAIIPILTLTLDSDYAIFFRFAIAILSSAISIISGILALNKYKELWVQYRTNCEILKSVLHRYFTHAGEFISDDEKVNFDMLVVSCELYLTKEFDNWNNIYSFKNYSSTGS